LFSTILGSSAFYAGGIAEQAVGAAAPWFILGIMLFSFAVRAVYVESCSMFTRGGVYRVVKEALGGTFAKLSVSALMFDYILTGPDLRRVRRAIHYRLDERAADGGQHQPLAASGSDGRASHPFQFNMNHTSAVFAAAVTIYYWWQNIKGIEESSGKALRVMQITTVMVVILLLWGTYSVFHAGRSPASRRRPVQSQVQRRCPGLPEGKRPQLLPLWACSAFSWPSATPFWP
jgi:hypothetical protein